MERKRFFWRVVDAIGETIFESVAMLIGIFALGACHLVLNWIFGVEWASLAVLVLLTVAYYLGRSGPSCPPPDQPRPTQAPQPQSRERLEHEAASANKLPGPETQHDQR